MCNAASKDAQNNLKSHLDHLKVSGLARKMRLMTWLESSKMQSMKSNW